MKRDAKLRKKSENVQTETTLCKQTSRKERKKTNRLKRKLTHKNSMMTQTMSQEVQQNNTEKFQKMEPETSENSQQIQPQSQIQPYIFEITQYLSKLDQEFFVENSKIENGFPNTEVTLSMRKTLLKWLNKFATLLKLKSQTLHVCVQLIDCILMHEPSKITKKNFQLLGVTCLFMASKLIEIINPEVKRFTDACDGLYTLPQLFEMEQFVLLTMNFSLQIPTVYQFVNMFSEEESISKENQYILRSLAQLCLYDFNLLNGFSKKTLCAVVIYLWAKTSNIQEIRSKKLMEKYDISQEIFQRCLRELMGLYRKSYLCNPSASSVVSN